MRLNWSYLAPKLKERGYCVFALTYGLDPRIATRQRPRRGDPDPAESRRSSTRSWTACARRPGRAGSTWSATRRARTCRSGGSSSAGAPARSPATSPGRPCTTAPPCTWSTRYRDVGAAFGFDRAVINLVSALCGSCPQFVSGSPEQRRLLRGRRSGSRGDLHDGDDALRRARHPVHQRLHGGARRHQPRAPGALPARPRRSTAAVAVDPVAAAAHLQRPGPARRPAHRLQPACRRGPAGRPAPPGGPAACASSSRVRRHRVRRLLPRRGCPPARA